MSSDVRDVGKSRTDLINGERVLGCEGVGRFTSREGSNDRGNVDAGTDQTRLPEPYVGIHRNAWKHFHIGKSNTAGASETVAKVQRLAGNGNEARRGTTPKTFSLTRRLSVFRAFYRLDSNTVSAIRGP